MCWKVKYIFFNGLTSESRGMCDDFVYCWRHSPWKGQLWISVSEWPWNPLGSWRTRWQGATNKMRLWSGVGEAAHVLLWMQAKSTKIISKWLSFHWEDIKYAKTAERQETWYQKSQFVNWRLCPAFSLNFMNSSSTLRPSSPGKSIQLQSYAFNQIVHLKFRIDTLW